LPSQEARDALFAINERIREQERLFWHNAFPEYESEHIRAVRDMTETLAKRQRELAETLPYAQSELAERLREIEAFKMPQIDLLAFRAPEFPDWIRFEWPQIEFPKVDFD